MGNKFICFNKVKIDINNIAFIHNDRNFVYLKTIKDETFLTKKFKTENDAFLFYKKKVLEWNQKDKDSSFDLLPLLRWKKNCNIYAYTSNKYGYYEYWFSNEGFDDKYSCFLDNVYSEHIKKILISKKNCEINKQKIYIIENKN